LVTVFFLSFCLDIDLSFFFFLLVADLSISSNCSTAVSFYSFELLKLIRIVSQYLNYKSFSVDL
jgi:hypothetical protein